jgi:predicted nucleic acid-binding protein
MKRAFVDANIILRYFTKDPPDMAEASLKTFSAAQDGQICLILIPITVAEVVWVLESFYGYTKEQIAIKITQFLHSDGIEVIDLDLSRGPNLIYSFDHHFDRIPGVTRLEPGAPMKKNEEKDSRSNNLQQNG